MRGPPKATLLVVRSPAGKARHELSFGVEDLHLAHAVVRHVQIARRIQAHAVGLVVDLSFGFVLLGQLGQHAAIH